MRSDASAQAWRAIALLGFNVSFYDPHLPNGVHKAIGIRRVRSIDDLLAQADVVSLHCPLTAETQQLIGERALARMRADSVPSRQHRSR